MGIVATILSKGVGAVVEDLFFAGREKAWNIKLLPFLSKKLKLLFETAEKMITFEQNIPALIKMCEFAHLYVRWELSYRLVTGTL